MTTKNRKIQYYPPTFSFLLHYICTEICEIYIPNPIKEESKYKNNCINCTGVKTKDMIWRVHKI